MKNPLIAWDQCHRSDNPSGQRFDTIIDVRTPLEYAHDHLPGAINAPILSNEQRVVIGTMFRQGQAHAATRLGAAMVARNLAEHLDTLCADRPSDWKPLVYCWRGGKRSGSVASCFSLIGWQTRQLQGGYKAYRRWVAQKLAILPQQFRYIVLTGHTGTGKTQLLSALARQNAQVLDLENMACHRGSLLGIAPDGAQPSQKMFDSRLTQALQCLDPNQPVFVEAESQRIGSLLLPTSLLQQMYQSACIAISASLPDRVHFLVQDYRHLFDEPEALKQKLAMLTHLHGKHTIRAWHNLVDQHAWPGLARQLIEQHYDPAYRRSSHHHFTRLGEALLFPFRPSSNSDDSDQQAKALLEQLTISRL
jgi:tRNA 2-selenouridine synthase